MIKIIRLIAIVLVAFASVSHVQAKPGTPGKAALTAGELRTAITGERFAYRGQFREGVAAKEFAAGYIYALAERASQQDLWCGFDKILPHELLGRVFDSLPLPSSTDTAMNNAAATEHVITFLQASFPCSNEQKLH